MIAHLSIVLDQEGKLLKNLETMELKELDTYLITNFTDSNSVRNHEKYKREIEDFLLANSSYLAYSKRKNNGRICITYTKEDGSIGFFKAFYKDDKHKLNSNLVFSSIKKRCLSDNSLLKLTLSSFSNLFSDFHKRDIEYALKYNKRGRVENALSDWVRMTKQSKNSYYYMRLVDRFTEKYVVEKEKNKGHVVLQTSKGLIKTRFPKQLKSSLTVSKIRGYNEKFLKIEDHIEKNGQLDYAPFYDKEELFSVMDLDEYSKYINEDGSTKK